MRVTKYVIFHGDELYSQYVGYEKGTGRNINMRSITNTLIWVCLKMIQQHYEIGIYLKYEVQPQFTRLNREHMRTC